MGHCRDDGTCWEKLDCGVAGNVYVIILCVGYILCEEGMCFK